MHASLKLCVYCQAANTAVSKSKRSICGHQVGSIAHTTDRVTHYRTCPTGQDAPEHQADLLPNTAAAHAAAASMQQAINLANFAASQNSLAAITRVGTNLPCLANSLFSSLDHRLTAGLLGSGTAHTTQTAIHLLVRLSLLVLLAKSCPQCSVKLVPHPLFGFHICTMSASLCPQ